jgi:hypothetical protein
MKGNATNQCNKGWRYERGREAVALGATKGAKPKKRKGAWQEAEMDGGTQGTTRRGRHHKGQRNHQCTNATRDNGYGDARELYIC